MKVIVLGATGHMGRRAADILSRSPEVDTLALAGRNGETLQALANKIKAHPKTTQQLRSGNHIKTEIFDVSHRDVLARHIKGYDVIANATGPFYLLEAPIVATAIETGVNYVSICDDHDATEVVLKLDAKAKKNGITVVSGAGWTPGLTNMMAKKGVSLLDRADQVHVSWAGSSADAEGLAVILHTLHILTGDVPTFKKGEFSQVRAGSDPMMVRFPDPIGTVKVRHVGHPEPITIPRFIHGLEEVTLRGGLTEKLLNRLSVLMTRIGVTRTPAGKSRLAKLMIPFLPLLESFGAPPDALSGAHVEVKGVKDNRNAAVELSAVGHMRDLTAIPHAVTTLMVGRGDLRLLGVISLEVNDGPDPDNFFQAVGEHGIRISVGNVRFT